MRFPGGRGSVRASPRAFREGAAPSKPVPARSGRARLRPSRSPRVPGGRGSVRAGPRAFREGEAPSEPVPARLGGSLALPISSKREGLLGKQRLENLPLALLGDKEWAALHFVRQVCGNAHGPVQRGTEV